MKLWIIVLALVALSLSGCLSASVPDDVKEKPVAMETGVEAPKQMEDQIETDEFDEEEEEDEMTRRYMYYRASMKHETDPRIQFNGKNTFYVIHIALILWDIQY